mgnify:CR=1 FL=1
MGTKVMHRSRQESFFCNSHEVAFGKQISPVPPDSRALSRLHEKPWPSDSRGVGTGQKISSSARPISPLWVSICLGQLKYAFAISPWEERSLGVQYIIECY